MTEGKTLQELIQSADSYEQEQLIKLQEQQLREIELQEQREARRAALANVYQKNKQPAVVDDSRSIGQQNQGERVVSNQQKKVMDERAQAFLKKQEQMKEEIKKKELEEKRLVEAEKNYQADIQQAKLRSQREQMIAIERKIEDQNYNVALEQSLLQKQVPLQQILSNNHQWMMRQLYEQRSKNGDFVFEIRQRKGKGSEQEKGTVEILAHSQVLNGRSQFFRAMQNFDEHGAPKDLIKSSESKTRERKRIVITKYSQKIIEDMIYFFYLGECSISSDDLVDLFELSQEFILTDLKQLLEQTVAKNVDLENFEDTLTLVRHFECHQLKQYLFFFAQKNYQELYRKGMLKSLTRGEVEEIKQK